MAPIDWKLVLYRVPFVVQQMLYGCRGGTRTATGFVAFLCEPGIIPPEAGIGGGLGVITHSVITNHCDGETYLKLPLVEDIIGKASFI